jgi:hypothetical protein
VTRYIPSRHFLQAGVAAVVLGAFSAWCGRIWVPAYGVGALFVLGAAVLMLLAFRPTIEIHETYLAIGRRGIPWGDIRRVDHLGWMWPLVVRLTLADRKTVLLVYAGDADSAAGLLRHLRRYAQQALIDGHPRPEFLDEEPAEGRALASPRYRLLLPEDEAEVERLYQKLKTVRHLDPDGSGDEE